MSWLTRLIDDVGTPPPFPTVGSALGWIILEISRGAPANTPMSKICDTVTVAAGNVLADYRLPGDWYGEQTVLEALRLIREGK
jgi:hypothetical protein